jgi:hypothetical protein
VGDAIGKKKYLFVQCCTCPSSHDVGGSHGWVCGFFLGFLGFLFFFGGVGVSVGVAVDCLPI